MTCIIGYADGINVYMVGDKAAVVNGYADIIKGSKVFQKRTSCGVDVLIGYTHSFRMGQVLEYSLKLPPLDDKWLQNYLCTDFVGVLHDAFKEAKIAEDDKGVLSGGTFLIGLKGRLFGVYSDFSVIEVSEKYNAVGCGCWEALSVMAALDSLEIHPEKALPKALFSVAKYNTGVKCDGDIRVFKI